MPDLLLKGAQRDLLIQSEGAPAERFVWDHAERVSRIAEALLSIPELNGQAVDRRALLVAAFYHDAGWVLQVRSGDCHARDVLLKPTTDIQREMAADWMTERVSPVETAAVVQQAARIIRFMNNRRTELIEARVLADAESLDEIGPHSVCLMVRKMCAEGKTIADAVALWERQGEYRYWPARIKEGFHFATSRSVAQKRLDKLARFMDDLREAVRLEDISTMIAESQTANP
jgi:hypothetical protein